MILKRYNDDNINENRDYSVHKPQVEIDNPTLYPDDWKEMDGIFMHPKNEDEQRKEIIERLSDHWKDKLNNELIIPKSLYTYSLDELITLENYYINENKTIWDKYGHNLPKIFTCTKYGLPSDDDLKEINQYNLSADDIIQGFGYTIIGKGIQSSENINNIVKSIKMLCDTYPDNEIYEEALSKVKMKYNINENVEISDKLLETLKELKHIHMSNEAVEDIRIENNEIVFDVKCETDIQANSEYNGVKLNFNKLCGLKNINECDSFEDEMTEEQIIEHARMVKIKTIDDFLSDIYDDSIIEQAKSNTMKCFKDFFNEVKK